MRRKKEHSFIDMTRKIGWIYIHNYIHWSLSLSLERETERGGERGIHMGYNGDVLYRRPATKERRKKDGMQYMTAIVPEHFS